GHHSALNLVIFKPRESDAERDEEALGPIAARAEPAEKVLDDPRGYYGDLADPAIGGANALFACGVEAAQVRGLPADQMLIGPPATFGFEVDASDESVVAWRRHGVIGVEAVGFSLNRWDGVRELLGQHMDESRWTELAAAAESWTKKGFGFGVAMLLKG